MKHSFKLADAEYNVALSRTTQGYLLHINEHAVPIDLRPGAAGDWMVHCAGDINHLTIATHGDDVFIHLDGATHRLGYEHPLARLAQLSEGAAQNTVRATMPGSLVSVHVKAGENVAKGDPLLVIESMKMETSINAARNAMVETVHVGVGETFDKDSLLITLAPEGGA